MKWRLKKKKGLLEDPTYRKIKELIQREIEEEAAILERSAEHVRLPEELEK